MNAKLQDVLKSLSDGELCAISKSFMRNSNMEHLKMQLNSKSNVGDFDFSHKEISDGIIDELTERLLTRNIDLGKRNIKVSFLKRLFKFRFLTKKK
jgi:hypothetical protein